MTDEWELHVRNVRLRNGERTIVDEQDADLVDGTWTARKFGTKRYATKKIGGRTVLLHRVLMGVDGSPRPLVDHVNGNGLDNRRANLRVCSSSQNGANSKPRTGASEYKGVSRAAGGKWRATIRHMYQQRRLGTFDTEVDAARAYDAAARELFGPFAKVNFEERTDD